MKLLLLLSLASSVLFSGRAFAADDEESRHDAFKSCIQSTGVAKPARGQRPSDEDRAKIEVCMTEKGFDGPPPHPRHHHHEEDQQQQSEDGAGAEG